MKLTRDELIDICSEVTTMLGDILAAHVELNESLVDQGAGVEAQRLKLDALKARMADERLKLRKLRDAAKRKRDLERLRKQQTPATVRSPANEGKSTQSRVALLNAKGKWIGWIETQANGNVNVYDARHRIVAREMAGITLDRTGKLFGRGRLGLVALGQSLRA